MVTFLMRARTASSESGQHGWQGLVAGAKQHVLEVLAVWRAFAPPSMCGGRGHHNTTLRVHVIPAMSIKCSHRQQDGVSSRRLERRVESPVVALLCGVSWTHIQPLQQSTVPSAA